MTTTVIGDDQDGNPGADWRTLRQLFTEPLPYRPPSPIFVPPSGQDQAALDEAHLVAELIGTLGQRGFPSSSAWRWAKLLGAVLLVPDHPPGSIFLVALLTDRSPLGPQGGGVLTEEPLLGLPIRSDIRGGCEGGDASGAWALTATKACIA